MRGNQTRCYSGRNTRRTSLALHGLREEALHERSQLQASSVPGTVQDETLPILPVMSRGLRIMAVEIEY